MAFDVGDPIPLIFRTIDAAGNPADVTTAVLTVTLPDGTSVTPAVGAPSPVGTYQPAVPYIATQAGIHRVSWVGTGVNAQSLTDAFNVLPADPGYLISLAEARRGIRMTGTVTDEDLRSLIADVTPIIENIVGSILPTQHVETYDGGSTQISLLWSPVISVTSIVESYGSTYVRALTAPDIFTGAGGSDIYAYTVDLVTGIITRRAGGVAMAFPGGKRNIQVSYTAGRTTVGGNILRATRYLIRHLWQMEQGQVPLVNGQPMASSPVLGFAVPNIVIEMCGADTRPQGLA
jgi:hypothetical protein